jgi:hypothetical protein
MKLFMPWMTNWLVWKLSGYEKVEESVKNRFTHLLKEVFSVKIINGKYCRMKYDSVSIIIIETESYFILQCRQITYLVIKK